MLPVLPADLYAYFVYVFEVDHEHWLCAPVQPASRSQRDSDAVISCVLSLATGCFFALISACVHIAVPSFIRLLDTVHQLVYSPLRAAGACSEAAFAPLTVRAV